MTKINIKGDVIDSKGKLIVENEVITIQIIAPTKKATELVIR